MEKQKIILVDDHTIIRNGLKELIEKLGPFKIVGEYGNGLELIKVLPLKVVPDLIIMDIAMPEMDGEETMANLNKQGNKVPVLILTLNQDDAKMIRLFRLGVRGYLQKNCTASAMREALEEIFRCGYYHNEFLTRSLMANEPSHRKNEQQTILEQLTDREKEFLKHVCHEKEYTYDQIAGLMNVQHRTVDGYRESIFEKFGIKSKTGLVLFILRHNLLEHL